MSGRWRELLGETPESDEIISLLSGSLAPSTARNYGDHLARFIRWCDSQPDRPQAFPASTVTVLRWLAADVTASDRVRAGSLQPYLSAINRVHRDMDEQEPALGHLVQQYRRGLAHRQADAGRGARRVYLPPDVADQLMEWALAQRDDDLHQDVGLRRRFRASVAVVLTLCLFARGGTGSALCVSHMRAGAGGITVTLDHEKGKRVDGTARTITFPPGSIPGLEELLRRWESLRDADGKCSDGRCYFAFNSERARFPSTAIDTWLSECLAQLGAAPPAGEKWSGHSLRKCAASGAAACGVALHKICYVGGWSIKSKAVFDYIDPTCPKTPACLRSFGWLR